MNPRSNAPQSFENHRAFPPLWFFLAGMVLLAECVRRAWLAVQSPSIESIWIVVVCAALFCVWIASRSRAQIVQDRVIHLEMRARLERLLGAGRRADVERLPLGLLIALRFASDAEIPALFDEALAGKFERPMELKQRIRSWQPDWLRL